MGTPLGGAADGEERAAGRRAGRAARRDRARRCRRRAGHRASIAHAGEARGREQQHVGEEVVEAAAATADDEDPWSRAAVAARRSSASSRSVASLSAGWRCDDGAGGLGPRRPLPDRPSRGRRRHVDGTAESVRVVQAGVGSDHGRHVVGQAGRGAGSGGVAPAITDRDVARPPIGGCAWWRPRCPSLRRHYPVQVRRVGGAAGDAGVATLSARLSRAPQGQASVSPRLPWRRYAGDASAAQR